MGMSRSVRTVKRTRSPTWTTVSGRAGVGRSSAGEQERGEDGEEDDEFNRSSPFAAGVAVPVPRRVWLMRRRYRRWTIVVLLRRDRSASASRSVGFRIEIGPVPARDRS